MPCDGSITPLSTSGDGIIWANSCCDDTKVPRVSMGYLDMRKKLTCNSVLASYTDQFTHPSKTNVSLSGTPFDPTPPGPIVVDGRVPGGRGPDREAIPPDVNED